MINDPMQNGSYGGDVAAPVFRAISDYVYNTDLSLHQSDTIDFKQSPVSKDGYKTDLAYVLKELSVDVSDDNHLSEWVLTKAKKEEVEFSTRNIHKDLENNMMPNIKGMGLSDVLYLLENYGLKVNYNGRGSIKYQSIDKGQRIRKGQQINIVLS